ncbi:MAG: class I SAM-dependent methyltransferase, partial [Bacteroidota bacterium]|nr:class I SAM-dependent methyltransferase [Bacteroidota bacterium]
NREAILSGKVKLQLFSISECPQFEQRLDKILDVNSFQFWPDPVATLTRLRGFMNHSGTIVLVHQPRKPGATDNDAMNAGQNFCMQLEKAGFTNLRIEMKMMKPVSTIAAVGTNPD